ncbi:MAG TPA: glycine cleavage system protein GcvH [Abditibacteriaceae bacterium]|nr:glycine cleavage system protein GcvH [Abditibacteriaceae bacterium]
MNVPENLQYALTDEWVRVEGGEATLGITDYAQHELGEIVYVELPEVGTRVSAGEPFGVVESVKAVSELVSPISGEVTATNDPLTEAPAVINDSPYESGWMIRVRLNDTAALDTLMDAANYAEYRATSDH